MVIVLQMRKLQKEQEELLQQHEDGGNIQGKVLIILWHLNSQKQTLPRKNEHYLIYLLYNLLPCN